MKNFVNIREEFYLTGLKFFYFYNLHEWKTFCFINNKHKDNQKSVRCYYLSPLADFYIRSVEELEELRADLSFYIM